MSDPSESVKATAYPVMAEAAGLPVHTSPMLKLGGLLGVAACALGLILLLAGCAGFDGALKFAVVSVSLAVVGLLSSLGGALWQSRRIAQDTHVLQGIFVNLLGIIGATLEMAVAFNWKIFYK